VSKVGDLNGGWSVMFRIGIVLMPITITAVTVLGIKVIRTESNQARASEIEAKVLRHGEDLAEIRGNRFTSDDGLKVWQAIALIQTQIARLPTKYSPPWLVERLDRVEESLRSINNRLRNLEIRPCLGEPKGEQQ